jgi:hypothetical protein
VAQGIHVDVQPLGRLGGLGDAVEAGREVGGRRQIGVGGAIGEPSSKRPGSGTRTMWVRLLPDQVTVLGAQVAPEAVTGALIRL